MAAIERMATSNVNRTHPRSALAFALAAFVGATPAAAQAATACPGNPDALSTSRVITVSAATTPRVGRKHFPQTLPLADKEVVLTFDDGPWPGTTAAVLDALKRECVRATFFLIGRNAAAHPELVRRERAEGHTVAHHSFRHPLLDHMRVAAAEDEIAPGFVSSPALLDWLEKRGIVVVGADLWASDWNPMNPTQELRLVLERLEAAHGGIVLFHDTKRQTAAMLPALLRSLKAGGYRVVHVVGPAG